VHEARGADDLAAEDLADALVAEADSKDRDFSRKCADGIATDARLARRAGAGETTIFSGASRSMSATEISSLRFTRS
jgi:hypothetical protein